MLSIFKGRMKPSDLGVLLAHTAMRAGFEMIKPDVREFHARQIGVSSLGFSCDLMHLSIACHEIAARKACRAQPLCEEVLSSFHARIRETAETSMSPEAALEFMTPLGSRINAYRRAHEEGTLGETFSTVCGDHNFTLAALVEVTFGGLIGQMTKMVRKEVRA